MRSNEEMDDAILSNVGTHWAKVAMVAARAMDQLKLPSTDENFEQLRRRVELLAQSGRLHSQGDFLCPDIAKSVSQLDATVMPNPPPHTDAREAAVQFRTPAGARAGGRER